jgi:ubiquinone/menaquinone biosynthesis C-methylase UbiE
VRDYSRIDKCLDEVALTVYPEPYLEHHEKLIDAAMEKLLNGNMVDVLDVGFGTGYSLRKFKELGKNVTGISLDDSEIKAMEFQGFNVKKMGMEFIDFPDDSFDLVWCRHTLEHSVMPFIALMEFKRVLRKDGYLYIEVPADSGIHINNINHFSMFSDQVWQAFFGKLSFKLLWRGQFVVHVTAMNDLYWYYWLKKE